ncbi:carboxymuconolactone decarboxylase family protein [uncultured Brachyspira sp.]|uniref:carboxymuconolactone decarboxylase family protein n=1 Tax=uncultured Brachyspira sp. TaxID=221953 RepID=UPI00259417D0|nr:carboxymuconolactone decarboxylase family protein [uncultured Brachyspira sp.]
MLKRIKYLVLIIAVLFMFSCINKTQNSSNMIGERTMKANEKYKELLNRDFEVSKEDEDLQNIFNNFVYGEVYNHGNLEPKLRELITLVSLTASDGNNMISEHVEAALNVGASAIEIKEALYQCAPYVGFPRVFSALEEANKVFKSKNISLPLQSQSTVSEETRFEKGLTAQTSIFGDRILDMHKNSTENLKHIQNYLSAMCFGDFYTREGLDLKTRELLTFIMLISLGGAEPQATSHAKANISMGNDKDILIKAVTQCIPYIGYPRTLNAITIINGIN